MKTFALSILLFAIGLAVPCPSFAGYLLESATLGPTGVVGSQGGYVVANFQYVGARFHISQLSQVDHIGGVLGNFHFNDTQQIFGAIVPISGPGGFPASSPATFAPSAVVTFTTPTFTADMSIPVSVVLPAGDYALIFGSGRFGATGRAGLPTTNHDTAQASYFFGSFDSILLPGVWENNTVAHNMRFTVTGVAIPEPSSIVLAALGLIGLAAWGWRRKR